MWLKPQIRVCLVPEVTKGGFHHGTSTMIGDHFYSLIVNHPQKRFTIHNHPMIADQTTIKVDWPLSADFLR